ncbi:hypothetical protein FHS83_001028 [Rhizomicrobium palustre]|uniref:Uncharacterized protein n=1 Tax=Rhizomicrobium palustre TaxID=189966 RepID=A0A846MXG1_9PROT|nr:hypothetical protein [Rhizomicrobium palustre]
MGWEYFFCEIGGEAAVMAVDRSLKAAAENTSLPRLYACL